MKEVNYDSYSAEELDEIFEEQGPRAVVINLKAPRPYLDDGRPRSRQWGKK